MTKMMQFRKLKKIVSPAEYISIINMKDGMNLYVGQMADYTGNQNLRINNIEVQPIYYSRLRKANGLRIYVRKENEND